MYKLIASILAVIFYIGVALTEYRYQTAYHVVPVKYFLILILRDQETIQLLRRYGYY